MNIVEIAELAGVSKSTVSRVLTGSKDVSKKTREKVLKIISENNFVPNRYAKNLSTAKSNLIGVIVPDIKNSFYVEMIDQLEVYLKRDGYNIFLCNTRGEEKNLAYYFNLLSAMRAEGIFYISPSKKKVNLKIVHDIPLITIDGKIDDDTPYILCKHRDGIKMSLTALVSNGCKNILYITGLDYFYSVINKNKGYNQAVKTFNNIKFQKVKTSLDSEKNYEIIKNALISDPTIDGISCVYDELAFITIRVLRELNKVVSKDVLLVGYDDSSYIGTLAPDLSSIKIPIDKMAKIGVEMMVEKLKNNVSCESKLIELELIKRKSLEKE